MAKLFDNDEDKQALSLILNWFEQLAVHGKIERIDFEHLSRVYSSKQKFVSYSYSRDKSQRDFKRTEESPKT